jgi:hypothetical protein
MGVYTAIAAIGLSVEKLFNRRLAAVFAADPQAFNSKPQARLVKIENFDRTLGWSFGLHLGTQIVLGRER